MRKKIFFSTVILLFLSGSIYWFFYTKKVATPATPGMNAVPMDAAFILESKKITETWRKLSQTNIMWEELCGLDAFASIDKQATFVDSILQSDPLILPMIEEHSVIMSAHPGKNKSFELLYIYSLPNLTYKSSIEEFLEKINHKEISYTEFENEKLGEIHIYGKPSLTFCVSSGVLIMSLSKELVQSSIRQLSSKVSLSDNRNFKAVLDAAGKNVDANFYINYEVFPDLLSAIAGKQYGKDLNVIKHFAAYSGWDITLKPNALMLNGFTSSDDSASFRYLDIFKNQKPQSIDVINILPSSTAYMMFTGISNAEAFQRDKNRYLNENGLLKEKQNYFEGLQKKYGTSFEKEMLAWADHEMAMIITEPDSENFTDNSFAVFHSADIPDALNTLHILSDTAKVHNNKTFDTLSFRAHVINRLNIPGLLSNIFGNQFKNVDGGYFTSVNDYIVFGNSEDALKKFISDFENNKILANNKNYQAFAENMSGEASIYFYLGVSKSFDIYKSLAAGSVQKEIDRKLQLLQKFESAGIQFSYNDKLFYSNLYLKYNPEYKQETGTLWETKLDTTVSSKPYLLINHNTQAKEVFIQDDANKIYLISNTGKIIWTKQLNEKIMSDVIQLDVLKNNKLQMIFNTRSYIYMFDRNGNDMKGFPLKLGSAATNSISVMDYEGNRDYRIFICTEDKKILCYKTTGEAVDGFVKPLTESPVYLPVQYFKAANKDHLCAIDQKGKVYIMDRHGEIRVPFKERFAQGIRNFFVEPGKDYRKTYITSADSLGTITRITLTGDKEQIRIQEFETSPYFEYRDINNDKTREYIFLTRNELKVFNPDKTLLFTHTFNTELNLAPQLFLFPDGITRIGVSSETENELYLFDPNGSLHNLFPLNGKTIFSIGDLNNEGLFDIVTGSADNSIYVYQLKE